MLTLNFPEDTVEFQIKGVRDMERALNALVSNFGEEVGNGLRAECEVEMTEAKQRTPVLTGTLRASGHVKGPVREAGDVVVTMGFGGPAGSGNTNGETNEHDVGYAVWVHENEEALHPHGEAKFLERTVLEAVPTLPARVAARCSLTRMMGL